MKTGFKLVTMAALGLLMAACGGNAPADKKASTESAKTTKEVAAEESDPALKALKESSIAIEEESEALNADLDELLKELF